MSDSPNDAAPPEQARFRETHLNYLTARAVTLEMATRAGLRSVDATGATQLLQRGQTLPCGGLAIPYREAPTLYYRVRLDEAIDGARFLAPAGVEVPIYVAPGALDDPSARLHIVEGPIKALALSAVGIHALGLGGTGTTLTTKAGVRRLNDSWNLVQLVGREVTVIFDAGRRTNPNVARDEARLALALEQAGAKVSLAELPLTPNGGDQGPDDYLARAGVDALRTVIAAAVPAAPVALAALAAAAPQSERVERVAALLDNLPFLMAVMERGSGTDMLVREVMRAAKVTAKQFDAALARMRKMLSSASRSGEAGHASLGGTPYKIIGGRLSMAEMVGEESMPMALANFSATIEREVVIDDGAEVQRRFEVHGALADGTQLPTVLVEAAEFATGRWPLAKWGARANVSADRGAPEHVRAAIQELSHPVTVQMFGHTGVREIDGQQVFLHAGGAVGGANVLTNLEGALGRYRLPDVPVEPREALELSLALLDIGPREVTVPLLSAMYRAPTSSLLASDSTMFLIGQSGSTKSTQAALNLAHFGDFDRVHLPATWADTAASIETTLFRAKDVPVVIDDFAPKGNEAGDEMRRKAASVLRAIGNGSARGRMKADMTARVARPPRGYVISTGEDLPTGESILARVVPVRVDRRTTNLTKMGELERVRGRLPHAMTAFIAWVLANYSELGTWLRERFRAIQGQLQGTGNHLRTPEALAHLALGTELLAGFAVHLGVFDATKAKRFIESSFEALRNVGAAQGTDVAQADPVLRFIEVLSGLYAQGKVTVSARSDEDFAARMRGNVIGLLELPWLYLLPAPSYAAVVDAMAKAGESMPIKEVTLWERLRDRGLIQPGDAGHHTIKKTIAGQRVRVLAMDAAVLGINQGDEAGTSVTPARATSNNIDAIDGAAGAVGRGAEAPAPGRERSMPGRESPGTSTNITENKVVLEREREVRPACPASQEEDLSSNSSAPPTEDGGARTDCTAPSLPPAGAGAPGHPASALALPPGVSVASHRAAGATAVTDGLGGLITDDAGLRALADKVTAAKVVGIALLTSGPDPLLRRPLVLAVALPDGSHVVDLDAAGGLGPLADALHRVKVVGHGLQLTLAFLQHHYAMAPVAEADIEILSKLLGGGANLKSGGHTLDAIARSWLQRDLPSAPSPSDVIARVPGALADLAHRVGVLPALTEVLGREMEKRQLKATNFLELAVLPSVVATSLHGVGLDAARLETVVAEREVECEAHAVVLRDALGDINLNSGAAVLEALRGYGLPVAKTGKDALAPHLGDPVARALVSYRRLLAFTRDLAPKILASAAQYPDGRVRPTIKLLDTTTGRQSYTGANLQGVEKGDAVRSCIVPAPGHVFVVGDYAAIDLRALADHTKDATLIKAFKAGEDLHRATAARLAKKPPAAVTDDERRRAKAINFGIVYGMSAATLASYLFTKFGEVIPVAEAQHLLDEYLRAHPKVAEWQQRTRLARADELRTASGRLRRFGPGDSYAQRLNAPIQGTVADGLKLALIKLHSVLPKYGAGVVLTVHDEIVVEVPREHAAVVVEVLRGNMIDGMALFVKCVPIVVEVTVRTTWADGSKIDLAGAE